MDMIPVKNKMHTKMYARSWIFLHKHTDSAFCFDSLRILNNSWSISLSSTLIGNNLIWKGLRWNEGRKKKEESSICDLVGSRFFLMNPTNYLFQKSLTKGVITNLDLNMHLDSHIYASPWLWFDV